MKQVNKIGLSLRTRWLQGIRDSRNLTRTTRQSVWLYFFTIRKQGRATDEKEGKGMEGDKTILNMLNVKCSCDI